MSSDAGLPLSPTSRNAVYYKMNHPKRGIALIFNHEYFRREYAEHREGTNIDCQGLKECLQDLGFVVRDYHNLNLEDIEAQLKEVAGTDHTHHDCLVVAVLTHGNVGTLYAYDKIYNENIIWSYFTSDKCKTLAGKPKMFFIQACRGKRIDHGSGLRERTVTDGSRVYRIPCHADFLIAYATIPGYYAWRIPSRGTWFILALCSELSQRGRQFDLLTLLTFVCQRVALEYESHDPIDVNFDEKKQVPYITSMLTRLVQF